MHTPRKIRGALSFAAIVSGAAFWSACTEAQPDTFTAPSAQVQPGGPSQQGIALALAAQTRHTAALMRIPGVVGTAVGLTPDGRAAVRIFLSAAGVPGLPAALDDVPTRITVSGPIMARSDPTTRLRPAPLGFSVGHPLITAGTIGALVLNGAGTRFVLSNNHVLANSNDASPGDPMLQPGPFDGGAASDQIGTLFAFRAIDFSGANNSFDAAIALTTSADVANSTPADDGYGTPSAAIWGDANGDGLFDNRNALLNVAVQKYGRTTRLTKGHITGINATFDVCYEAVWIFCLKSARFVDQLVIGQAGFSDGGDSGSLIVTDDAGRKPVALLFAGSAAETIANRIDLVLTHFGVTVDGGATPPPGPLTDVAITSVSAPGSVTVGNTVSAAVTVQNVGNQDVAGSFDVTLRDATADVILGSQTVAGLAPGASTTRTFSWNTTGSALGPHILSATHTLADDNAANNQGTTSSSVNPPSVNIHVGDLDAFPSDDGTTWSATVEITVHDNNHQPLNGATVVGNWSRSGLNANTCTTGELGGNGTCIVLFPGLRRTVKSISFTVTSVTMVGNVYVQAGNHDADGSSNGTSIKVNRP